jgi:hypothetical protein
MEGSFFTESDLSEQDRHRLDCVTRFEGTLVEKAGLHPLALGPNRKLDRLVATLLRDCQGLTAVSERSLGRIV